MKQFALFLIVFISVIKGVSQIYDSKPDALRNIEEGKALVNQGDIEKAIEKFNFGINHGEERSALLLRADVYLRHTDTCNSCKDLLMACLLKSSDTVTSNLFEFICLKYDTIRSQDNSLFIEYPKYNYTLLGVIKCTGDSLYSYWDANDIYIESISTIPAKYPRGRKALNRFIKNSIKYPQEALVQGIQGTVIIKFKVLQDGNLDNFTILKEIGGGCEAELIRVLKTIPKFQPATKKGIPIETDFTYYFTWTIRN